MLKGGHHRPRGLALLTGTASPSIITSAMRCCRCRPLSHRSTHRDHFYHPHVSLQIKSHFHLNIPARATDRNTCPLPDPESVPTVGSGHQQTSASHTGSPVEVGPSISAPGTWAGHSSSCPKPTSLLSSTSHPMPAGSLDTYPINPWQMVRRTDVGSTRGESGHPPCISNDIVSRPLCDLALGHLLLKTLPQDQQ